MTPVKVIKKKPMDKISKIDTFFKKIVILLANFAKVDMVKLKKPWELGVLTSEIKRDGHKKKIRELDAPGIRRNDCTIINIFKPYVACSSTKVC